MDPVTWTIQKEYPFKLLKKKKKKKEKVCSFFIDFGQFAKC